MKTHSLAIEEKGEGRPVIFIPGLAGRADFWRGVASRMSGQFHCIAIDHPGIGGSVPREVSIPAITSAVFELMDEMKIEKAALVGHSTGGLIAQTMSINQPARVCALVLSSTWGTPDRRFRDLFRLRLQVLRECGEAAYRELGALLAYPPGYYEAHIVKPSESYSQPDKHALTIQRIEMLFDYTVEKELAKVTVPTLCIGAVDDQIIPFTHTVELSNRILGAQLVQMSGGHFTPVTQEKTYADSLSNFLLESANG